MPLKVKLLTSKAVCPARASKSSAGYDLSSAEDTVVPAHGKALVSTGLSVAVPPGTYGRIAPRSGLAWKKHIDIGAGVVDPDYRGPVGVVLFNHGSEPFEIKAGDRIAQLILERIETPDVEEVDDLDATDRGDGGFGSTGVQALERTESKQATVGPKKDQTQSECPGVPPFSEGMTNKPPVPKRKRTEDFGSTEHSSEQ